MSEVAQKIDSLDHAIHMDQAFIARDLLEWLDERTDNQEVKKYYADNAEKLDRLRTDIDFLTELLHEINSDEGWTKSLENKEGSKVYFKKEEDSPLIMTKLEALIPSDVSELPTKFIQLVSIFNENDLMPKWFPLGIMRSNETLVQPTPFTKCLHIKLKLPFPLNQIFGPRDVVVRGKGYDLSERKAIAISVQTLEAGMEIGGVTMPGPEKGVTRMILRGAYYCEMVKEGIRFKQMQQIDLNSRLIPAALMNMLAKGELPIRQFSRIRGVLSKYEGSEWEKRVGENKELYPDVKARLMEALKTLE